MFSSHWFSKLGAVLGSALTILPILNMIPGAGPVVKIASTVIGTAITLVTQFDKVKLSPAAPTSTDP